MKYVKSVSLFFVYPACCFILGLMTGSIVRENADADSLVYESEVQENDFNRSAEKKEELEEAGRESVSQVRLEEIMQEQYVMNPNALQEIEQEVDAPGYFITIRDGNVIVYHGDRQTVFLSTDIRAEELPVDVQVDLETWMYMTDEGMLYDFLENYTS